MAVLPFTRRWQILYVSCCKICTPFDSPPILLFSFIFWHHPLSTNLPPFRFNLSLSLSLNLSVSLGMSFLSAFYSKSDHKAFIQPNLRDSGYIWFAWCREMLHQWKRWRAGQKGKKHRGREGNCHLIRPGKNVMKANSNQSYTGEGRATGEVTVDELKMETLRCK